MHTYTHSSACMLTHSNTHIRTQIRTQSGSDECRGRGYKPLQPPHGIATHGGGEGVCKRVWTFECERKCACAFVHLHSCTRACSNHMFVKSYLSGSYQKAQPQHSHAFLTACNSRVMHLKTTYPGRIGVCQPTL